MDNLSWSIWNQKKIKDCKRSGSSFGSVIDDKMHFWFNSLINDVFDHYGALYWEFSDYLIWLAFHSFGNVVCLICLIFFYLFIAWLSLTLPNKYEVNYKHNTNKLLRREQGKR